MSKTNSFIDASSANNIPSTAGMTTKVVKGSFWTIAGQFISLLSSVVAIPFILRFLGSEGYGVLVLVLLIPNYFAFVDFGMGLASTKFGAEAYSQSKRKKEAEVIRNSLLIALSTTSLFALPVIIFSHSIIENWFNVPERYQTSAAVALKITTAALFFTVVSSILNTPLMVRLRMDLAAMISAFPKVFSNIATPMVLYLGLNVTGASVIALLSSILTFAGLIFFSGRYLPELFQITLDRKLFRPLIKFGGGLLIATIASILLVNVEKFFLARYVSVQSLAYYSVAFTLANMTTMFSQSISQSLIPAFSQILAPEKRDVFNSLFSRSIRLTIIWLLPAIIFMFVTAKPLFYFWAGADFAVESTLPFYILLVGLFFNIFAIIPHTLITSSGRTDILAKIYWVELILYVIAAAWLVFTYQIVGAAIAWTLRVIFDAFVIIIVSRKLTGVSFNIFSYIKVILSGIVILMPPMILAVFYNNFSLWIIPLFIVCVCLYLFLILKLFVDKDERHWINARFKNIYYRIKRQEINQN